jgi:hypothetical protein
MIAGSLRDLAGAIVVRRVALVLWRRILVHRWPLCTCGSADVQAKIMAAAQVVHAVLHIGNVRTRKGHPYKLLDAAHPIPKCHRDDDTGGRACASWSQGAGPVSSSWPAALGKITSRSETVFIGATRWIWVPPRSSSACVGLRRRRVRRDCARHMPAWLVLGRSGGAVIAINSGQQMASMVPVPRYSRCLIVWFVVWLETRSEATSTLSWNCVRAAIVRQPHGPRTNAHQESRSSKRRIRERFRTESFD